MNAEEAKELINKLDGDEHSWVDFKLEYAIGGIAKREAEFIKDIASMANIVSDRQKCYILVGVNDTGDIVGVDQENEDYDGSGPRSIFSYDESDIQEIIDSNLEPVPSLEWHTFDTGSNIFGTLIIETLDAVPTLTTQHINDSTSNRVLHKGLVYIRRGSSKKIADHQDIENMIEYRIRLQRQEILDGIHKAIEIGPEWIDRIGEALPEEPGIPLQTTDDPEEADIEVTQRISREPASTLDEQLNEDIARWDGRGDDFIEHRALYQYYSEPHKLTLDDVAVRFLTQSALKNDQLGIHWLRRARPDTRKDIVLSTPDMTHRVIRAAKVLVLMNNEEALYELLKETKLDGSIGELKECKQKVGSSLSERTQYLYNKKSEYTLKHADWSGSFEPAGLNENEIKTMITEVGNQLIDLQEKYNEMKLWERTKRFRRALWDLEVALGAKTFS